MPLSSCASTLIDAVAAGAGNDVPLSTSDACASRQIDAADAVEGLDARMCPRPCSGKVTVKAVLMATFGMVMLTSELTLASDV